VSGREESQVKEVRVEEVVKQYRWFTLSLPVLRFGKGLNLVIGPNGSGKSTLLKIMAGFTFPNRGTVRYVLREGACLPPTRAYGLLSYVAEDVRLPNMRVHELLRYFTRNTLGIDEVTELMGLTPYIRKRYYELSNGYRKRVQLAIALLMGADVIIMDEPFSNVDVLMIAPLKRLISKLSREKILVITSHLDLNIEPDTLTVLNQGKLVYHGGAKEVMRGRHVFVVKVDGGVRKVNLRELNDLISGGARKLEVLDVVTRDTSEILQELVKTENPAMTQ